MSERCNIPSMTLGACDLEIGHDGDMHASHGDGFQSRAYAEDHARNQRKRAEREAQVTVTLSPEDREALECVADAVRCMHGVGCPDALCRDKQKGVAVIDKLLATTSGGVSK